MSEYWKSTERYWCKHCKLYVKDTKIERQNHDATPRHQGNLKRFVRDLHRNNEKDEREKQRAKDEVARLNGAVSGSSTFTSSTSSPYTPSYSASKQPPQMSRKDQLQQLVELGVAIPDEFRKELSMTGDWQTVSETLIDPGASTKNPDAIGYGVRKRENPEDEEEDEVKDTKRRRWESTHKTHIMNGEEDDLDALLSKDIRQKSADVKAEPGRDDGVVFSSTVTEVAPKLEDNEEAVVNGLKKEVLNEVLQLPPAPTSATVKQESLDEGGAGIVFKKRAKKNIRQK